MIAVAGGLSLLWTAGMLVGLARIAVGWRQLTALSRVTRPLEIARHGPTLERVRLRWACLRCRRS